MVLLPVPEPETIEKVFHILIGNHLLISKKSYHGKEQCHLTQSAYGAA